MADRLASPAMRIGIPREIKDGERRVALVPAGVRALPTRVTRSSSRREAGAASGFADAEFAAAGAQSPTDAGDDLGIAR